LFRVYLYGSLKQFSIKFRLVKSAEKFSRSIFYSYNIISHWVPDWRSIIRCDSFRRAWQCRMV